MSVSSVATIFNFFREKWAPNGAPIRQGISSELYRAPCLLSVSVGDSRYWRRYWEPNRPMCQNP